MRAFSRALRLNNSSSFLRSTSCLPLPQVPSRFHGEYERKAPTSENAVNIVIIDRKGVTHEVQGKVGDNLLYLMHTFQEKDPKLYLEGDTHTHFSLSLSQHTPITY